MAIQTYGAELHSKPRKLLVAEWNHFVTGGRSGSSRERLASIAGIAEPEEAMRNKIKRWAASIYEGGVEEVRETARTSSKNAWRRKQLSYGSRERIEKLEVLEQQT